MRLIAPTAAPRLNLHDIYGQPVTIGGGQRRTLLCFFRDAACPFCNFRIYQLTDKHQSLSALGLDIVAVFTSSPEQVKRFVARKRRPFQVVADPSSQAHEIYGIERSLLRKLKAIVTRVPTLLKGLRFVGLHGLNTTNLMPADFLIDEQGNIVEAYYGADAGDHIAFERVELFLARGLMQRGLPPAAATAPTSISDRAAS
ncbi:MAG TPA: redoxin domain-containing protein [Gammaproteobacteria bacterium]|nr:redoxin domain-containing protein [Gammaproteobacteria bacterium]